MITPLFGRVHFKTNYNYRLSNHCLINELILVTYALISNAVENEIQQRLCYGVSGSQRVKGLSVLSVSVLSSATDN